MSDLARTRTGQKEKGPCKLFVGQFAWPFFFGFSFITTAYRSYSHPWKCRLIVMTANSITWDSRCTIHDARFTVGLSADSVSMLDWAWCHGAGSEGCRHAGVGGILFHARNLDEATSLGVVATATCGCRSWGITAIKNRWRTRRGDAGASLPDVTALVFASVSSDDFRQVGLGWTRSDGSRPQARRPAPHVGRG